MEAVPESVAQWESELNTRSPSKGSTNREESVIKPNRNMGCRLCQKEAALKNSHIVPEFFYTSTYDALHRFRVITTNPDTASRFVQKGLREHLLCGECEQHFGRWEHYAKEKLIDSIGLTSVPVSRGVILKGIDYANFKLFLLSILWRMGVSTLDEFKEVELGTHHEGILRTALLSSDPLAEDRYCCLMIALTLNGVIHTDWIIPPTLVRFNGQHCYRVLINGVLYCFFVSKQPAPQKLRPIFLNLQNEMLVLMGDVVEVPFLHKAVTDLSRAIKKRNEQAASRT